jgi:hypothetical protein
VGGAPCPFFSLEYCNQGSLADRLGKPLPPRQAAALVRLLARATNAAHRHGIIHRDLKPGNVLLTSDDGTDADEEGPFKGIVPKITDFGLARMSQSTEVAGRTQTGAVMGTPSYMAPEQAAGRTRELGPACDVYALGAILYECLTGRPPFHGASVLDTLLLVMEQEPTPPRVLNADVPLDLETICLKCLQKEPRHRYATAAELAGDLRRYQEGVPILARPAGLFERLDRWVRKKQGLVLAWATAVLAGLVLLTVLGAPPIEEVYGLERIGRTAAVLFGLPVVLGIIWAGVRASRRASSGAVVLAAALVGALTWLWPPGSSGVTFPLYLVVLPALALLASAAWPRRRISLAGVFTVVGLVNFGGLGGLLLLCGGLTGRDLGGVVLHGLILAFLVRLVSWCLVRDPGTVALGALVGAGVGLGLLARYGEPVRAAVVSLGWSPGWVGLYLEVAVAFLGAIVGGLLGPAGQGYRGAGDQVVPSENSTPSTATSARVAPAGQPGS